MFVSACLNVCACVCVCVRACVTFREFLSPFSKPPCVLITSVLQSKVRHPTPNSAQSHRLLFPWKYTRKHPAGCSSDFNCRSYPTDKRKCQPEKNTWLFLRGKVTREIVSLDDVPGICCERMFVVPCDNALKFKSPFTQLCLAETDESTRENSRPMLVHVCSFNFW